MDKENFEKFSKKNFAQISFGNHNYAKFSKENLESLMKGKIIDKAELIGIYYRE